MRSNVTSIVVVLVVAPVKFSCTPPATLPDGGSPPTAATLIDRFAGPVPDEGVTWIHGWVGVAVHVIEPDPFCVSRTSCAPVDAANTVPVVVAPKRSEVLSNDTVGEIVALVVKLQTGPVILRASPNMVLPRIIQ